MTPRFSSLLFLLCFGLSASAIERTGKPVPYEPSASDEVVLLLPKEGIEETKSGSPKDLAFGANINYGKTFSTLGTDKHNSQDIDGYDVRWLSDGLLEVSKLKGTTTKTGTISYGVQMHIEETPEVYRLKLTLVDKRQNTPFDLMRSLYTVKSFETEEALSQLLKPIVHFQTEVNSEYGPESLRANYERLGVPAEWNRVMANRFNLRKEARFYTMKSTIPGVSIQYVLDVFPYRNGSKAVISGQIIGAATSDNTADMSMIVRTTLDQIKSIALD